MNSQQEGRRAMTRQACGKPFANELERAIDGSKRDRTPQGELASDGEGPCLFAQLGERLDGHYRVIGFVEQ
jgi:hypothetical protein